MSIFEAVHKHSCEIPDEPALIDDEGAITWGELPEIVDRVCLGLVHQGMRRGRGVALLLGRSRHQFLAFLAVLRGGSIVVPLASSFGAEALKLIVSISDPRILIYDDMYTDLMLEITSGYEFRAVIRISKAGSEAQPQPDLPEIPWELLEKTDTEGARFPQMQESSTGLHNFGVDATGAVRGGVASLKNLWMGTSLAVRALKLRPGCRHMSLVSAGLWINEVILRPVRLGGTAVFSRSLDPRDVVPSVQKNRVDAILAPARYFHVLCDWIAQNHGSLGEASVLEARGRVSPALAARAKHLLGRELLGTWSSVETLGPAIGAIPTGFGAPAAPMQPYPGFQEKIVNPAGEEILDDAIGDLLLTSEAIAKKSIEAEITGEAVLDDKDWLHTGLMARRHSSGKIEILGSRFDVILREGQRVYPCAIAHKLEDITGVREADGVVVEPGAGCLLLVIAVLLEPAAKLSTGEMEDFLEPRLEPVETPDRIVIRSHFPRLPDGGVDRMRLREELVKQL